MADSRRPLNDFQSWLQRGLVAVRAGDRVEAHRCFQAALEADPDNIETLLWLAWLAPTRQESLVLLCRVLELDPENDRAHAGIRWARRHFPPEDASASALYSDQRAAVSPEQGELSARFPPSKPTAPLSQQLKVLTSLLTLIAQRLIFGVLVLVAIIFLSHLGLSMARGTGFYSALAGSASETLAYLGRLGRGDLGLSEAGSLTLRPVSVAEAVPPMLSKSLGLLSAALLLATFVGVNLGIWAAGRRYSGWSLAILLASIAGVSVPSFFAALILQLMMIRWARIFGLPLLPIGSFGWDEHMVLPALVLATRPIAQIARVTFVSVGEVLNQDFVRTAHSKGLKPRRVINRHVIRNAAIPILTTVGLSLRFSLSSLPVVEFFFGWPGVGFTLLKAISRQDDNLTVALALCLGILFILVNLALEIGYRFIDPRLRQSLAHVRWKERGSLLEALWAVLADLWEVIANNPLSRWLSRRRATPTPSPFRTVLERQRLEFDVTPAGHRAERRRAWLRGTLGNSPFVVGAILVAILITVFVFGPGLAPHSPYTTQSLAIVNGQISVPPFAPSQTHPWGTDVLGRDIMSLILAGAQQTLLLATLVVLARVVVGFILGALAGWLSESWVDRLLLGAAEAIAAFPSLLLAMILILALGIRQGLRPFVIALCFVGWGEIMQFVRGEVIAIRPKLFIESAVAVGLRTSGIILRHVLPNLISALMSITALEMGAVLMLLGELGFIGIFIGGGAFAQLEWRAPPYHYSDVPEWGSLLSNVRTYARAYPWMAVYPALAFFIAILGFNLFGEGMRRMVEKVGLGITRLVNRYTVALALLGVLVIGWVQTNTGAIAVYQLQASNFDGQQALTHVQALADPALKGRALDTPGMDAAAEYIAHQFEALGLQAAGEGFTYFQNRKRVYGSLDAVPRMGIEDEGPPPVYHQDYVEYPGYDRNLGQVRGRVRFLAMGELSQDEWGNHKALKDLNFSDEILLLFSPQEFSELWPVPQAGALIVAEEAMEIGRLHTLSGWEPSSVSVYQAFPFGTDHDQGMPVMWISEATANRLLRSTGRTVTDLRRIVKDLTLDEVITLPTETTVSMEVQSTVHEGVPARHVIGHLPGLAASIEGAPTAETAKLDDRLIVVLAQYDSPPPGPEGMLYPAANDNASGVAVMLEAIRTMRETGYQPYRTLLFVAYSGEGQEGGEWVYYPKVSKFLQAKLGFATSFELEAVVRLRGVGAGQGEGLVLSASGSRLVNLFETSARRMGVQARHAEEPVDISIVFEDKSLLESGQEAPDIRLSWEGWEMTSRSAEDTLETVSAEKLEQAGRALSLALMILGREPQY